VRGSSGGGTGIGHRFRGAVGGTEVVAVTGDRGARAGDWV